MDGGSRVRVLTLEALEYGFPGYEAAKALIAYACASG